MPDRNSSNELVWELMREVLQERGKELSEGLSLRSLDRRLVDHTGQDDRRFDRLESRLRELEQGLARTQGHEDRNMTPAMGFQPLGIPINMGSPPAMRSKRPSIPAWAKAAVKPAAHWLGMVLIAFVVAAAGRCEKAHEVPAAPVHQVP
jgi:hypothetical protein